MLDLQHTFVLLTKILTLIVNLLNIHIIDIHIYVQKVIAVYNHANLEKMNLKLEVIKYHIMNIHT